MNKRSFAFLLVGLCALTVFSAQAQAEHCQGCTTSDPNLPPVGFSYEADPSGFHRYPNVDLSDPIHDNFRNVTRTPIGPDEQEHFDSDLSGMVSVMGGPPVPIMLSGPVTTLVSGKVGNVTGTFATEITDMLLSGPTPFGPVMIRESPSRPSLGVTSITATSGGRYHIDSFFDVFTDLSLDGGQTWQQSENSTRMSLCPEPASLMLVCLALLGIAGLRVRK